MFSEVMEFGCGGRLADLLPCGIPLSSAKRGYVRGGSQLAPQISINLPPRTDHMETSKGTAI
jgi:hypothetical protein